MPVDKRHCLVMSTLAASLLGFGIYAAAQEPGDVSENDLARADTLIGQGKIDQALVLLKDLAQKEPKAAGLEARLGKAFYEKHSWGDAVSHLEAAVKQDPGDAELNQLLGLSYFMNGRLREAIPILEKVQSQLPRPDVTGTYLVGV